LSHDTLKLDSVRKLALSLPGTTEAPHHDYGSFRVGGRIFVTIPPGGGLIHVFLSDEERDLALAMDPEFLEPVRWGRKVPCVRVKLAVARPSTVRARAQGPRLQVVQPLEHATMSFLAFALAAIVLAITPGPGIAYVVARTVAGGRAEGLASCFGTGIGGMLHVLAAALGLSLVVARSALAFGLVKWLGAAYLVYLGIRLLVRKDPAPGVPTVAAQGPRRALVEGIVVEALNVKTALFFLAFLPQFVAAEQPLVPQVTLLGSICVALNTLVDVAAVLAAARLLRSDVARAARARLLTRVSGVTMLGLGAYLALARRQAT
jgi:threonine/homoserine/homoserine lactone efflux protein